ncbi:MAG: PQQ-like beta-propeller repeat protein [Acidimicrobiia bacterium]|nr:PQQ-like beta-propeller repeat protein [Acidimicrobiia bacterium]
MRTSTIRVPCRAALAGLVFTTLLLAACAQDEVLRPEWTWEYEGEADAVRELTFADDAVWVGFAGRIQRVRASDGEAEATIGIEGVPTAMAVTDDGVVWTAVSRSATEAAGPPAPAGPELVGIDAATNAVIAHLPTGLAPDVQILDIAVLDEIWFSTDSAEVFAIDPMTGTARRILKSVAVLDGFVAAGGRIWMLRNDSALTALDPDTGETTVQRDLPGDRTKGVPSVPPLIASGSTLWVVREGEPPLVVLDGETGDVTGELALPDGWSGGRNAAVVGDRIFLTHGTGETAVLAVRENGEKQEFDLATGQRQHLIGHGTALYMTVDASGSGGAVQRYRVPDAGS